MMYDDDSLDRRLRAAASWTDDGNWREVRRRARRDAAPATVVVAFAAAVVLAAPAYAFRDEIVDLIASPESNEYVWENAACGNGSFTLAFDPEGGASVVQDGETLATASMEDRGIECDAPVEQHKTKPDETPYHGSLGGSTRAAGVITCTTTAPLEVVVNPIWRETNPITHAAVVDGSSLVVVRRDTKELVASAIYERDGQRRNWARAYWSTSDCSAN